MSQNPGVECISLVLLNYKTFVSCRSMDYDYRRGRDADAKGSNSSRQRDREPAKDKTASALKVSSQSSF